MKLAIIFYHPKNPLNLLDVASLAASQRAPLYVVRRPGTSPETMLREKPPRLEMHVVKSLGDAVRLLGGENLYIVLETYGNKLLHEVNIETGKVVIVVGAEDYGIPREELGTLPETAIVARIPTAVEGMSYNVASTVAMAIYEVKARLGELREGTRGTYEAQ